VIRHGDTTQNDWGVSVGSFKSLQVTDPSLTPKGVREGQGQHCQIAGTVYKLAGTIGVAEKPPR
jgi:hypothetical protein